MSNQDDLLKAAQRDRRRVILTFMAVLVATFLVMGTGWLSAWNGREAWHEQSIAWQGRYVELYGEFVDETGEEPQAPDPDAVAKETPATVATSPGPPGPVGPTGAAGRDASASQIASAVTAYCSPLVCVGPAGKNGSPGTVGAPGVNGAPGAAGSDSTVPGPQGPQGAPGPAGQDGAPGSPGADGAPGKDGSPGLDGRGIAALMCDDTGTWQVTYTDGTTAPAGACRTIDPVLE